MNTTMPTEISLEALVAGDRAEFARLVDAYSSPIYRLGLRMLGNPQDAEDVLQNTFISVLTHIPEFEGRSSLATWLYRIAANEALMLLRKKKPEVNLDDLDSERRDRGPAAHSVRGLERSAGGSAAFRRRKEAARPGDRDFARIPCASCFCCGMSKGCRSGRPPRR